MNRRPLRLESGVMSGMIDLVSSARTVILVRHDLDAIEKGGGPGPRRDLPRQFLTWPVLFQSRSNPS
jgi:hypothetical protein